LHHGGGTIPVVRDGGKPQQGVLIHGVDRQSGFQVAAGAHMLAAPRRGDAEFDQGRQVCGRYTVGQGFLLCPGKAALSRAAIIASRLARANVRQGCRLECVRS